MGAVTRRSFAVAILAVVVAACGGSDTAPIAAVDEPGTSATGAATPSADALAGVGFDVRRDPG